MCEKLKEVTWLDSKQTAAILGISKKSLLNMAYRGVIPFYKLGRRNRYKLSELNEQLQP
jgi:excisionase family DNA binding protein